MKSILLQLYDGEIYPAEQYSSKLKEYSSIYGEHYQNYKDFIQKLKEIDPPLEERFTEIMDEQLEELPFEISGMFIDGFRLGARMIIEIYENNLPNKEN